MSTDYSKMSDTEIAQKVFFWLSSDFCPNGGLAHINNDGFFFFDNRSVKRKFDPCNNPADAWPIIVEERIRLNPILYTKWIAEDYLEDFSFTDINPLRAAMIVFLMMQESKNAS
nr:MAG TPA: Protein of unknown function (DUF2591) [Caudoviricetes sp.]